MSQYLYAAALQHSFPFMACESHGRICNCRVVWTVTDSVDNIVGISYEGVVIDKK